MPKAPYLTDEERVVNIAASSKKYRDQHKEKYSDYNKNYYQINKEKIRERRRQRRLEKKQ